ncbi:hypothetical protein [Streptacidiphilus anmyonensis]|uniref:hypothetical protein n=1 Tax=Streptacidiphilus anmyonensis TaxID=405782 RepID=UPI0005A8D38A|nr:hypothetical protein [Streptacidiphilus anmyonensis]
MHPNDARREGGSRAVGAPHAPADRLFAAYWCEAVAHLPASGHSFWLAACPVSSPSEALGWITDRAERLAEQLDASAAEAARGWLVDGRAHQRLLLALTEGSLFMHTIPDAGVRHILSARPVQVQVQVHETVPMTI